MTSVRTWRCAWLSACAALFGCDDGRPDGYHPEDDLEWLVRDYETPSGELDMDRVGETLDQAGPLLRGLLFADDLSFILGTVQEAADGFRGGDFNITAEVNVSGRVDAHLACPGGVAKRSADSTTSTGRVDLTLPVNDSKLGPAGEGSADGCAFDASDVPLPPWLEREAEASGPHRVMVDGPLQVHLGAALSLREEIVVRPTVRVLGTLNVEGLPELSRVDFRSPDPRTLEVRVVLPTGAVIVFSDGISLGVRERRGTWFCETDRGSSCVPNF